MDLKAVPTFGACLHLRNLLKGKAFLIIYSLNYIRVSGEEESHVENFELPSEQERTETDFYCASIPDEIDSIIEESKEQDISQDQLESDNEVDIK